jgi:uncharacterized protein (DUF488 family)
MPETLLEPAMPEILTVGHSTLTLEQFLALLRAGGAEAIVDIRRYPSSRRHPHFSREALSASLGEQIAYLHLPELGGRRRPQPDSPHTGWTQGGFRGYADHLRSDEFAAGLRQLEKMATGARTAVMCAEGMWWRCHRRLVADVLLLRDWKVQHLLPEGRTVGHELPDFAVPGDDGFPYYGAGQQGSLWSP